MVLQQWTNDFQGLSPEQDGQESLPCRESKPGHCQNKCCINVDHAETLIKEHLKIISRKDTVCSLEVSHAGLKQHQGE